jgi:hypothetical protein
MLPVICCPARFKLVKELAISNNVSILVLVMLLPFVLNNRD